jgi:hypothetical protein
MFERRKKKKQKEYYTMQKKLHATEYGYPQLACP